MSIVSDMQLVPQVCYLCSLYLALSEIPEFEQPFVKSRLQRFPFMCRSLSALPLDNTDGGAVIEYRKHPFAQALHI